MAQDYMGIELPENYLKRIRGISDKKKILNGSHRGRDANFIGYLGMDGFVQWVNNKLPQDKRLSGLGVSNLKADIIDVVNYDVLVSFKYKDKDYSFRVEIKTKDRTCAPRPSFEVSVPSNTYAVQMPDYYFALSLERKSKVYKKMYFLGFISREDYDTHKYLEKAGEKPNGAVFFTDTWNVKIDRLKEYRDFPLGMIKEVISKSKESEKSEESTGDGGKLFDFDTEPIF